MKLNRNFIYRILWPAILVWALATCCRGGEAYRYFFNHYNLEDGMSARYIKVVVEDDKGFIWIGHKLGLERFDGKSFEQFFFKTPDIVFDSFSSVIKDHDGIFWLFFHQKGCRFFDPASTRFLTLEEVVGGPCPVEPDDIVFLKNTKRGIWLMSKSGDCYIYDGQFRKVLTLSDLPVPVTSAISTKGTCFWVSNDWQVHRVDTLAKVVRTFALPYNVEQLVVDEKGILWCVPHGAPPFDSIGYIKNGRLFYLDLPYPETQTGATLMKEPFHVFYRSDGQVIIQMYGALIEYDSDFNFINNISKKYDDLLQSNGYLQAFLDSQDNLWVATYNGIYHYYILPNYFDYYEKGRSTRGITQDFEGRVYINTYGPRPGHIVNPDGSPGPLWIYPQAHPRTCLYTDHDGTIWSGLYRELIYQYNPDNGEFFACKMQGVPNGQSFFIKRDSFVNKLWVGTKSGLCVLDEKTKSVKKSGYPSLDSLPAKCIFENNKGLWIGSGNGLVLLNPIAKSVKIFPNLSPCSIEHIYQDENGTFWLSTYGCGIIIWTEKNGVERYLTKENGLSSNFIHAVYEDKNGHLWMPADYGLMRLDKNSCSIDVFMPSEGLLSEEFNRLSHYQSADGRLWFGGIYGVNVFQPEQLELHKGPAPPLLFSKIEILRDRKWQILSGNVKNIELRSEDRSLYIEFIMPEYRHPNSIRYSYKMDGLDDDWHYTKDNALHFEELLPGKYVLRIRGQATGGIWAANELALPIRVFAPFYKRVEFYLIMGLLFTLSSYLFFQYRLTAYKNRQMALEKKVNERSKELLEKNKQLQHLDKIKNQLFAIIAHDMKNALVTFRGVAKKVAYLLKENQTQRLLNMGNNIDEASENLSSILDNLLHWAISEQGRMPYHPEKVNLRKIVDETIQLYAGMAQAKGVSLFNKVPKAATAFADAQSIGIILRNLIGNAIKYNHQGHHVFVMTTSAGNADKITLIVEDDGIGIPPGQLAAFSERDMSTRDENSQKGAGLGLMLTRMLIRQNGGEMKVESTPGRGTRVSLTMPVEAPPIKKRLPKQAL